MKAIQKQKKNPSAYLSLLGPAFVAAIAYIDPGNFATNFSAGAQYKYLLIWVLVVANVMAGIVQYLSAKAGLVTGKSLPELVRDRLSGPARICYWLQAEIVSIATDIAEVLGGAIALTILFGIPLIVSGLITGAISLFVLNIQTKHGQRPFEAMIIALLLAIGASIFASLFFTHLSLSGILTGLTFTIPGKGSLLLIAGMFGATIMPHVVYLHSALARDRHGKVDEEGANRLLSATRTDVFLAMLIAGSINIAMLLLAAAALFGVPGVDTLIGAHAALGRVLGAPVALLFALGLLISGLASTSVGSYAGAVVMEGLLNIRIPLLARRLVTLIPALIVLAMPFDPTHILILSQVVLSLGIPFAIIPLVMITGNKKIMGTRANNPLLNWGAILITAFIVILNVGLIVLTFF